MDATGMSAVESIKSLRESWSLSNYARGMAQRAGWFAETHLGVVIAGYASDATKSVIGWQSLALIQASMQWFFEHLSPEGPTEAPLGYDLARLSPAAGTGIRLAETIYTCAGQL